MSLNPPTVFKVSGPYVLVGRSEGQVVEVYVLLYEDVYIRVRRYQFN